MNSKRTIKPSIPAKPVPAKPVSARTGTGWNRVDALSDADVRRAILSDPDAAPEMNLSWFRRAKVVMPEPKQAVSIRLDRDVMMWFKKRGTGYQTRINAVLRAYVDAQR